MSIFFETRILVKPDSCKTVFAQFLKSLDETLVCDHSNDSY